MAFIDSATAIEGLLTLCQANDPILDPTYGNGVFWKNSTRLVCGFDAQKDRGPMGVVDFRSLPFANGEYPTVVFDPPFHPFVGSAEERRFSAMGNNGTELKRFFQDGVRECWRVTSHILIVKCQGFIHNHTPLWMPLWAVEICGEPFEWLIACRTGKRTSGRWQNVKSLRRAHADYLVFNKNGNKR